MELTENLPRKGSNGSSPDTRKKPIIWVAVGDKHKICIFRKNNHALEALGEIVPVPSKGKKITNKTVGRSVSSSSSTIHHKYEPHMNESRKESLSFAHEIADWLDKFARNDAFDHLVLVAAPQTLGDLRKILSNLVQARIIAEVNKDLTKMNEKELYEELEEII